MEYAMFTDEGNDIVHNLTIDAIGKRLSWNEVLERLHDLAAEKRFEEAIDTMVRESVFDKLVEAGVISEDTPFYI